MPSSRGIFPTQASTADVPYRGRSLHLLSQRGSQAEGEEEVRHEAPPPPRSPASVAQAPRAGGRQWGPGPGLAAAEAAEMACETERNPLGVFKCQLCALTAPYSYKGQQPPDSQSVILLEESYVMRDPFTPDKGRFLIVGSRCSVCSKLVCVDPECSLFYSKRFCLPCVQDNMDAFPQEIQRDLEKRKVPSTRPASQRSSRP
ncbi:cysteine-rich DPF motif domain-containing protein 1 isoform X1 [Odocoileus virginianus]|uniref:Cysteine-rich DPF motif domain-containing protein 1 n=1 Tax=Odocoileus virginianus TaxID=9874 RepID=A0A6J0Y807_ODOVR